MKSALAILLLAALALAPLGRAMGVPRAAEPARVAGQKYLRLSDWAAANHFDIRWLHQDETLQLSNHCTMIRVTKDSREAQINGVQIWLLYPPLVQSGTLCLAQLDADATLRPLLSPPGTIAVPN